MRLAHVFTKANRIRAIFDDLDSYSGGKEDEETGEGVKGRLARHRLRFRSRASLCTYFISILFAK